MRTLSLTLALALLPLAHAAECTPTSSNGVAVGGHYVYQACLDHEDPRAPTECMYYGVWNAWVYEESNGIAGLQRADELRDDTCGGMIDGDRIVL